MCFNRNKFFFEKFYNNNVQKIPCIESISLSFINKDKDMILLGLSALYILTNIKPMIVMNRLSNRRNSRSELIGCRVLLEKKKAFNFLIYLNLVVFPNISDFSGISITKECSRKNFINIKINNLLIFPELSRELDKFYSLKDLTIYLKFKDDNYLFYNSIRNFPVKL